MRCSPLYGKKEKDRETLERKEAIRRRETRKIGRKGNKLGSRQEGRLGKREEDRN